ncbi:hypothetical protein KC332_g23 [Hortaea werneckii]|nr:hypothetical protein KC348_g29 [Hortaea werneckii]KAI7421908.1 hypothetical protein KC332_g23 [Hortaea werneckii]
MLQTTSPGQAIRTQPYSTEADGYSWRCYGEATFVSEDAWSLATTASMLMRQYSALSERRVFLVKRLGFWTVPGMRVMAPSSEWDAQQWDAQQWDQVLGWIRVSYQPPSFL